MSSGVVAGNASWPSGSGGGATGGGAATNSSSGAGTGGGGGGTSGGGGGTSGGGGGVNGSIAALSYDPALVSPVLLSMRLNDAVLSPPPGVAFSMTSASFPYREGVCGNGVCEVGERCDASSAGAPASTCCATDCPLVASACPVGSVAAAGAETTCTGRGRCLPQVGACACYAGSDGVACRLCAYGYVAWRGTCVPKVYMDLGAAAPTLPLPAAAPGAGVIALLLGGVTVVIGVVSVAICLTCCAAAFMVWRRRRRARHGPKTAIDLLDIPEVINPLHKHRPPASVAVVRAAGGPPGGELAALYAGGVYARAAARARGGARAAAPTGEREHGAVRARRMPCWGFAAGVCV